MEQRLLHTPEGVRDIYGGEYARKRALTDRLHQVIERYGYRDIETPTFEYFDVFSREVGTIPSRDLYKFFDREGNTLVLRPDLTPPAVRAYAKYFSDEDMGVRLSYLGNTFINNSGLQGRLKETTQLGAELLGDGSVEADAEIAAMLVEILLQAGVSDFQVSVGEAEFVESLMREAGMDEETERELKSLLRNKNTFAVESLMEEMHQSRKLTRIFRALPQMFGTVQVLDEAEEMTDNPGALSALSRLRAFYRLMEDYGYARYLSFDLGMLGNYMYYTGIVFRAYTYGTGDAIGKGGRYDRLSQHFGRPAPAIGFVVQIDSLLNALERQKIDVPVRRGARMLLYERGAQHEAIKAAAQQRRQGQDVALVCRDDAKSMEAYRNYAKRNGFSEMVYKRLGGDDEVFDICAGEGESRREGAGPV